MDPKAFIDYALFQLTPTRTRCDLVVFSGKKNEKLASGLVEPFIAHLRYAKDHIVKGGYSITLRPPPSVDASWFTKATFQRFVRFVSTPEILERIVRIEREILQIESSTQSNDVANTDASGEGSLTATGGIMRKSSDSSKLNGEVGDDVTTPEENSRSRLQRVMDTRKALLRKEQAMAYARAVVAGFEMENIDDLICFADTFGASRLRDACVEFKEIYWQKHSDGQWIDELAAAQACPLPDMSYLGNSGILLAGESTHSNGFSTGSSETISDSNATSTKSDGIKDNHEPSATAKVQLQGSWINQFPQYMYNFQNPIPFPGMPPVPSYFPGHMGWPQNVDGSSNGLVRQSSNHQSHKSYRRKEKSSDGKGSETSEGDEQTESSESHSGTDSDEVKRHNRRHSSKGLSSARGHRKKSSKTVVIRNINYITSNKHNGNSDGTSGDSSEEDAMLDEASIKQGVDEALASLEKHHHPKIHKKKGHKGSHSQNGSNGDVDKDFRNDIDENISAGGKTKDNWDAFQDILMSQEQSTSSKLEKHQSLDFQEEHFAIRSSNDGLALGTSPALDLESERNKKQHVTADESALVIKRNGEDEGRVNSIDFANGEITHPTAKRMDSEGEQILFSERLIESGLNSHRTKSDFAAESSTLRNRKAEDWFVVNSSGDLEMQGAKPIKFDGDSMSYVDDCFQKEINRTVVDDSFIIDSRPGFDDQYDSNWRTDISMVADINVSNQVDNGNKNISEPEHGVSRSAEPDDLCVVLARESLESTGASWTPEMDYETEISFTEVVKKSSSVEANGNVKEKLPANVKGSNDAIKGLGREARTKVSPGSTTKKLADVSSKSKKISPTSRLLVQKSKLEKEEEIRKRMEELAIQRQKRIAERTAAAGLSPAASRKAPVGNRTAPTKLEKHRPQITSHDAKRFNSPKPSTRLVA